MTRRLRHLATALGLIVLAASLSACIVEEGGHRHGCYWHPC